VTLVIDEISERGVETDVAAEAWKAHGEEITNDTQNG
jgi:hypothetical protein